MPRVGDSNLEPNPLSLLEFETCWNRPLSHHGRFRSSNMFIKKTRPSDTTKFKKYYSRVWCPKTVTKYCWIKAFFPALVQVCKLVPSVKCLIASALGGTQKDPFFKADVFFQFLLFATQPRHNLFVFFVSVWECFVSVCLSFSQHPFFESLFCVRFFLSSFFYIPPLYLLFFRSLFFFCVSFASSF